MARRSPSPRRPLPTFLEADSDKEARILAAALERFVADGFHGTSIPRIARTAGVAAGTIYTYFASKDELVNALLARIRRALAARLAEAAGRASGIRAEFDAIWGVFAEFVREHERGLAFCDLHHHAPYLSPETEAAWAPAEALLDDHFTRGRAAGVYRDHPPALLRALMAGALLGVQKFARAGALRLDAATLEAARAAAWRAVAQDPREETS